MIKEKLKEMNSTKRLSYINLKIMFFNRTNSIKDLLRIKNIFLGFMKEKYSNLYDKNCYEMKVTNKSMFCIYLKINIEDSRLNYLVKDLGNGEKDIEGENSFSENYLMENINVVSTFFERFNFEILDLIFLKEE